MRRSRTKIEEGREYDNDVPLSQNCIGSFYGIKSTFTRVVSQNNDEEFYVSGIKKTAFELMDEWCRYAQRNHAPNPDVLHSPEKDTVRHTKRPHEERMMTGAERHKSADMMHGGERYERTFWDNIPFAGDANAKGVSYRLKWFTISSRLRTAVQTKTAISSQFVSCITDSIMAGETMGYVKAVMIDRLNGTSNYAPIDQKRNESIIVPQRERIKDNSIKSFSVFKKIQ